MLCQGITVCEGTGAPKTWHNLSLTLGSRQWTMVCQSVLWPATEHCVHLKQALKPWGCAEDGWVQLYYFPALSIPGQVLSLLESRGISGSRARDASPFLLLPCHHLSLCKSLFHPVSSAILYLSFKQFCHPLTPFPALWVSLLPQNGVKLIPALRSREERKSLNSFFSGITLWYASVLGKRWENAR